MKLTTAGANYYLEEKDIHLFIAIELLHGGIDSTGYRDIVKLVSAFYGRMPDDNEMWVLFSAFYYWRDQKGRAGDELSNNGGRASDVLRS
jgi:hypothetical protein